MFLVLKLNLLIKYRMDISLCKNLECPLKETCKRFKGDINPYKQSYHNFEYKDNKCDFYIEYIEIKNNNNEHRQSNKS